MAYRVEQYLTIRSCTSGAMSPDGSQIAYLSTVTGRPQVWRVPAEGGWPRQVTFTDDVVRQVSWSPDGAWLQFSQDSAGDERAQLHLVRPDGADARALTANPAAMHNNPRWSADSRWLAFAANDRDPRYHDVCVCEVASGRIRRVLADDQTYQPASFLPDGRRLLVMRVRGSLDTELLSLDLITGEWDLLVPHDEPAVFGMAFWLADGDVICLSDIGGEYVRPIRIRRPGDWEPVLEPGWDVTVLAVSTDGRQVGFALNRDGRSELYVGPIDDPKLVPELPEGVVSALSFDGTGARLAISHDGPRHPADIWHYDCSDNRLWPATRSDTAGVPRSSFRAPELVRYATFDGLEVPAWYTEPPGQRPSGGWPVVIQIHGGPESQTRPQFNPTLQYLVQSGYAVLAPNVRGSTGYGRTYHRLDNRELRPDAVRDAAMAVDWLIARAGADPGRIAVMGGSYGGYMVLALVTEYPELWAAGVDLYGVANFETFFANTGPYRRKHRASEYGDPELDAELLRRLSPIHRVEAIRCPMMVVQGATDPRVPQDESDQIVGRLRARGVPVEYLVLADEGHGIVRQENKILAYGGIVRFLDQHLGA